MFPEAPTALAREHCLGKAVTPHATYATLAPLYDALFGDHFFSQLRRIFEWLVRRYRIRFVSAADVACGTGTFVRYLRERGAPVAYGVDRSPEMLSVAITKNQGDGARFLLQDFATLQLPQPVDLITCHFDSLNYLLTTADLLQAFRRFRVNLNPGGHLTFDMITDQPPWQDSAPRVERIAGSGIAVVRVTCWDPRRSIQTALVSISRSGRKDREIHRQRGYPVAVVGGLLARAGFTLLGTHDFQTLGRATASTSRVVYMTRMLPGDVGTDRT